MDDLIEWLRAQLDATDVECWGASEYGDCHDLSELRHRDVDAKRKLITEYLDAEENSQFPDYNGGIAQGLEIAVRVTAEAYADRPGYKPEWRP